MVRKYTFHLRDASLDWEDVVWAWHCDCLKTMTMSVVEGIGVSALDTSKL